jgi:hypothetical protein
MTMATNMTEDDRKGPPTAGVDLARQENSSMARSCPWGHHAPKPKTPACAWTSLTSWRTSARWSSALKHSTGQYC